MKKFLSTTVISIFALIAHSQSIPNNSFETWTNGKTPDSWNNEYAQNDLTIVKATPGFDGSFAMKATVYHNVPANMDEFAWVTSRFAISASGQPQNLTFYYKANVITGDSSKIYLNLYNSGAPIGVAVWRAGQQTVSSSYKFAQVPVTYVSGLTPDSAEIIVIAGDIESGIPKDGTYVILDKIEFDGVNLITSTSEELAGKNLGLNIYPNPAAESVHINIDPINSLAPAIKIYDVLGKELMSCELTSENKIDISQLEKGIYFIVLEQGDQKIQKKFIKQ